MTDTFENIQFTYDSLKRKHPAIEELFDSFQYRDMIFQFVRRDIVARYKRSVLGIIWTILQPLGMMVVMTIIFSQLFNRVESYAAYLLCGLITWTFFAQSTMASLQQVAFGGVLARKIYVPYTAFVISSILTGIVNFAISLAPLFLIIIVSGISITWTVLFIPVSMVIISAFALGVGLMLSTFAVYFPDIKEMYQIILQAWMYITPVFYPEEILPSAYRFWILHLNPMYYMIRIFRDVIHNRTLPSLSIIAASSLIAVVNLLVGWMYFSKEADSFAYKA